MRWSFVLNALQIGAAVPAPSTAPPYYHSKRRYAMDRERNERGRFLATGNGLKPVSLRLHPDTVQALQLQADAADVPLSVWCRQLLETAAAAA